MTRQLPGQIDTVVVGKLKRAQPLQIRMNADHPDRQWPLGAHTVLYLAWQCAYI